MTFRTIAVALSILLPIFLSLNSYAVAPTALPDARSLIRGAELTIRVIDNDSDADGDRLVVLSAGAPTNGTTSLNQDGSITFISPTNFNDGEETVTFEYVLGDDSAEGLTDIGLVTITLTGAYPTYAVGQNEVNLAQVVESVCSEFLASTDAELSAGQRALADQCLSLEAIAGTNPDDRELIARIINQITPEEATAQTRVAIDNNKTQIQTVAQRVKYQSVARHNTQGSGNRFAINGRQSNSALPLAPSAGDDTWGSRPRLGVFGNIQIDSAERDNTVLENGYDSDTQGITLGADYFLNTATLIGTTLGFSQNDVDYANNDGLLDADITTLSVFGAYFLNDFSFYVQGTYGWLDYTSQRLLNYGAGTIVIDETIGSTTGGYQAGFNSRVDWQWQKNALTITPFARLDYLTTQVAAYEETGTSGLEMAIGEQSSGQVSLALGAQSSYVINMNWGVLIPNLSLTYLSETNSDRDPITARFAVDTDPARTYSINNDGGDSSFYQFSVGASAIFPRGITAFFDYSSFFGYENLDSDQLQFSVRGEF